MGNKITSFFKPNPTVKKPALVFDEDEIQVASRRQRQAVVQDVTPDMQAAPTCQTNEEVTIDANAPKPSTHDIREMTPPSSPLTVLNTPLSIRTMRYTEPVPAPEPEKITSSFASNTSSRRIIVNGVRAVTDSDSDELSSDDGLADISTFMPRKRIRMTPPHALTPTSAKSTVRRSTTPPRTVYKHSLANLVQQKQAEEAQGLRLKQVEAELHEATVKQTEQDNAAKMLADDENSDRVMAAIHRAEVFEQSDVFYFFYGEGMTSVQYDELDGDLPFPIQDEAQRQMLFESDIIEDVIQQISPAAYKHITAAMSRSGPVEQEYLAAAAAIVGKISPQASPLRDLYPTVLNNGSMVAHLPSSLVSSIKLLGRSPPAPDEFAKLAVVDLFLTNADENVRHSITTQQAVEESLQRLLIRASNVHESILEEIIHGKTRQLLSERQIAKAIIALPATSTALHRFRRYLALQHLLQTRDLADLHSATTGDRLLHNIPRLLDISTSDWKLFLLTVRLLDIAIDAGFSDFVFLSTPSSDAEKAFNRQVDALSYQLRRIGNAIRDSGATQLRRSEAKADLNSLVLRMELTVRTTPKKKRGVFDTQITTMEKQKFADFFTHQTPQATIV